MRNEIYYSFAGRIFPRGNRGEDIGTTRAFSTSTEVIGGRIDSAVEYAPDQGQSIAITITITGANNEVVYNELQAWRALRRKRGLLVKRHPGTGELFSIWARLVGVAARNEYRGFPGMAADVSLEFEVLADSWMGAYTGPWLYDDGVLYDTGKRYDEGARYSITAANRSIVFTYGGDYPESEGRIIITASATGIPAGLSMVSHNRTQIWFREAIPSGGALILDNGLKSVRMNGEDWYSKMAILSGHRAPGWFVFTPGRNVFTFNGSAAFTVQLIYHERFA